MFEMAIMVAIFLTPPILTAIGLTLWLQPALRAGLSSGSMSIANSISRSIVQVYRRIASTVRRHPYITATSIAALLVGVLVWWVISTIIALEIVPNAVLLLARISADAGARLNAMPDDQQRLLATCVGGVGWIGVLSLGRSQLENAVRSKFDRTVLVLSFGGFVGFWFYYPWMWAAWTVLFLPVLYLYWRFHRDPVIVFIQALVVGAMCAAVMLAIGAGGLWAAMRTPAIHKEISGIVLASYPGEPNDIAWGKFALAYAAVWIMGAGTLGFAVGRFCEDRGGIGQVSVSGIFLWLGRAISVWFETCRVALSQAGRGLAIWVVLAFIGWRYEVPYANWLFWVCLSALLFMVTRPVAALIKSPTEILGSAKWASLPAARQAGLLQQSPRAIYVGRLSHPNGRRTQHELFYRGDRHLLTIGPNRSGKGIGLLMPNVAGLQRSMLIIDPKGDAAAQTAMKRKEFGNVRVLNPFQSHIDGWPELVDAGFNPLASLDIASESFADEVSAIADAMIVRSSGRNAQFFDEGALALLGMLIGWECVTAAKNKATPTLTGVRQYVMQGIGHDAKGRGIGLSALCQEIQKRPAEDGIPSFIRERAERFGGFVTEALADVLQTAQTQTEFLTSSPIRRSLEGGTFDFRSMRHGITTVYLVLPVQELSTKARWLRMVVSLALRQLWQDGGERGPPIVFMLDEFAALGHLQVIQDAMDYAAGMGVQIWTFIQDLNQLKHNYGDRWNSFTASAGVISAFAPQDTFTANELAYLCGQRTVAVPQDQQKAQDRYQRENLVYYDDLMRMDPKDTVTLFRGLKPMNLPDPFRTQAPGFFETRFGHGLRPSPYPPRRLDD